MVKINFFRNTQPTNNGDITPVQAITKLAETHPDFIDLSKLKEQAIEVLDDIEAAPLDKASADKFAEYIKDRIKTDSTDF